MPVPVVLQHLRCRQGCADDEPKNWAVVLDTSCSADEEGWRQILARHAGLLNNFEECCIPQHSRDTLRARKLCQRLPLLLSFYSEDSRFSMAAWKHIHEGALANGGAALEVDDLSVARLEHNSISARVRQARAGPRITFLDCARG